MPVPAIVLERIAALGLALGLALALSPRPRPLALTLSRKTVFNSEWIFSRMPLAKRLIELNNF